MTPTEYNYPRFTAAVMGGEEFTDFRHVVRAGDDAPDGMLVDAETEAEVALSSLWRTKTVVIEFGSMT